MDAQFLEFWGKFFQNAARSQKQLEQMAEWIRQGFTTVNESVELFKKLYGLNESQKTPEDDAAKWHKAIADFENAFNQFARLFGWVAQPEYTALQQKCTEQTETIRQQDQTIKQLRALLEIREGFAGGEVMERFQSLIKDQSAQFQRLMVDLGAHFTKNGAGKP